jgi:hypothetical protein
MRTIGLTLVLAALFGGIASAAGPTGIGRMVVVPTTLTAGSTGNELTFTFTANRSLTGRTIVDFPTAGWSLPQRRSATAAGYIELKRGTCGGSTQIAALKGRRLTIATACKRGHSYQLLFHKATVPTLAADGYIFLTQTKATRAKGYRPLARSGQPVVKIKGAPATGLDMTLTSVATAGTAFGVTVRAIDPWSNNAFPYGATVTLTSSDPAATLPGPYAYTPTDVAQHAFTGVVLRTPGTQTITATDSNGLKVQSPPITVDAP